MHVSLRHLDHRPWPLPAGRWVWRQNWFDLLFAHWPVPVAALRSLVHKDLTIQEFNGVSWVGVVPFRMTGVMRRPLPDVPWMSAFPELNVRLYVERDGVPGVWFLSLDAGNPLAVWAARRWFHLPYWYARMRLIRGREQFRFTSTRRSGGVTFCATYSPTSEPPHFAQPGTLEHFLTERYCLYSTDPVGRLYRSDIHHEPWPLQPAAAEIDARALLHAAGVHIGNEPPLLHFSTGVRAIVWPLRCVST